MAISSPNIYNMGAVNVGGNSTTPTTSTPSSNPITAFNQKMVNSTPVTQPATFTGVTANNNFVNTPAPSVISNANVNTQIPEIVNTYKQYTGQSPVINPTAPVNQQQTIDYTNAPYTTDEVGNKKYYNQQTGAYDTYAPNSAMALASDPYSQFIIRSQQDARQKNDAALEASLKNITDRFTNYRNTQTQINQSQQGSVQNALLQSEGGNRGSVAQFAAATADARVNTIMADGQKKIQELNQQEQDLIAAAHSAHDSQDYKLLNTINSQIEQKRQETFKVSQDLSKKLAEEALQKQLDQEQAQKDNLIADVFATGVTDTAGIMKTLKDTGYNFTAKQINETLQNLASNNGYTDTKGLSQDMQEFYRLKNTPSGLPPSILSLPSVAEQAAAYMRLKTNVGTKIKTAGGGSISGINFAGGTGGGVSSGAYKSDLDALIGNALNTIPTKFGQQTFKETISKSRDDADKINTIATVVLKNAPAQERTDFTNQTVAIKQVDKAIKLLDEGVKTGAIQAGKQYLYNQAGKDFDPKLAQINQLLISAIQPYRNSITGAAWGDQEDSEYQQLFGSIKYSPEELKQRLEGVKQIMKDKTTGALRTSVDPLSQYQNVFESTGSVHQINPGDTLNVIAQQNGTTVDVLKALNPGINETNLIVGSKLNLPIENVHKSSTDPLGILQITNSTTANPMGI